MPLLHPFLNFGVSPPMSTSSNSSSGSASSVNIPSMPNGLPSGLSVTITPAPLNSNSNLNTNPGGHNNNSGGGNHQHSGGGNHQHSSVTITKSTTGQGQGHGQIQGQSQSQNDRSRSLSPAPTLQQQHQHLQQQQHQQQHQQQQQLRALAASLQSMTTTNAAANNSSVMNQASLVAAASKLMEMNANPIDDLVMQEVTQRLFKMNQEMWQQAGGGVSVSAAAAAALLAGQGQTQNGSQAQVQAQAQTAVINSLIGQSNQRNENATATAAVEQAQAQVNEIKMAEKMVSDFAAVQQQSTRNNSYHLNERTLQECWNTLQRVSCMIFMHKSAMQLQQHQQVAAHGGQFGHGHGLGLMRGSTSSCGSENGTLPKPHQCQQCLKSFSSNHQLVQHIRVHTGEKPYKCSYCDRRFKQLSHVQQHTRLHTGERPYKCHVLDCGRAFIQLSNLQQHLRNHDAQLERSKNRPFHCSICGKGFATESSLRTHTTKQHAALIGGPNAVTCPVCHKLFLGGEVLMEHMKHTHKDPNASGVATKRRTANHPCPICGKHYVNEGSLRKHLSCHPETAHLTSSLRMWPCSVCQAVFTHESGLLTHMEQMRMDPKHQFAAQYVLSRAAAERRERENIFAAAAVAAMTGNQGFGASSQGQLIPPSSLVNILPLIPPSPSGSESSGRLSSPMDTNSVISSASILQHNRMSLSSPPNRLSSNSGNNINNNSSAIPGSGIISHHNHISHQGPGSGSGSATGDQVPARKSGYENIDKYEPYGKSSPHLQQQNHNSRLENNMVAHHQIANTNHGISHSGSGSGHHLAHAHNAENGPLPFTSNKFQAAEHAAMKMATLLGQGHGHGHSHSHGHGQNELRNFIQQQANAAQLHSQDMMSTIHAEALLRSQAAEALRLAVSNADRSSNGGGSGGHNGNGTNGSSNSGSGNNSNGNSSEIIGNQLNLSLSHQQQQHEIHRGNSGQNGHNTTNSMHQAALNHQLNSILNQQDLSEAFLRQLDPRTLGFPLSAHNS